MGYSLSWFVEEVDDNLKCSICGGVLEVPVLTKCGHSFCDQCISIWLKHCGENKSRCPECRTPSVTSTHPILSLASLIESFKVKCESPGCKEIMKLESYKSHLKVCLHSMSDCKACGLNISNADMNGHLRLCKQMTIANTRDKEKEDIRNLLRDELKRTLEDDLVSSDGVAFQVSELAIRVSNLEDRLRNMNQELLNAEQQNKKLELDLSLTKNDLQNQHDRLTSDGNMTNSNEKDPSITSSRGYKFDQESVSRLNSYISRYHQHKSAYLDTEMVFNALTRCNEEYLRMDVDKSNGPAWNAGQTGRCFKHDAKHEDLRDNVHMLLATAISSNWFNEHQILRMKYWFQVISQKQL